MHAGLKRAVEQRKQAGRPKKLRAGKGILKVAWEIGVGTLRESREGPYRPSARKLDEPAPIHSMTSSASTSTLSGIVRPSRLRRLAVNDKLEFDSLYDRKISRIFAL
jgi:hypothetical protein